MCSGVSSVDAARGCPGVTSSATNGTGGTSGSDNPAPEGPSIERRIAATPGTAGLLNSSGDREGESTAADAINTGAEEEEQADNDVGRRGHHLNMAQWTGQPGGSNTLKPATL
ncbi:hypothetical protein NDU88_005923 [Pleurodeles waltl]|uniref:Uncharacterized protein n=1 Tax=Pleurodeles waltl TaxID=8319 RepID=A0AAV7VN69_PLEWA|nr:hypothetical protein NDU88_005923 [Pleurodeles waltl]